MTDDPDNLAEAFARAAQLATSIIEDVHGDVDPGTPWEQMRDRFADTITEDGIGLQATLDEFEREVLPHTMRPANPMYFGLINSSPLPAAVIGDMLVSAMDSNAGAFHHTRAIAPIEDELVRWFSTLAFGDDMASGQLVPAGSYANLQALILAARKAEREHPDATHTIYVSEAVHFSITRAASAAGVASWIRTVPCDASGAMRADALAEGIGADLATGLRPAAVFATAGTTATGAIDPIGDCAELCQRFDMWLHVDACYGGGCLLIEELRDGPLHAIRLADSVSIDPHKWFFMPLAAGLLLTRHPDEELRTFDPAGDSYIPTYGPTGRYRMGISSSRRASALAIWFGLRAHGVSSIREGVRRNNDLCRYLEELLRAADFEVLEGRQMSIVNARWTRGVDDEDAEQERIARAAVSTGKTWFSTTRHAGKTWLRFNTVSLYLDESHMESLRDLLVEIVAP